MKFGYVIFLALIASSAIAGNNYTCSGKIDGINQPYNGDISIVSTALFGGSQGGRTICNVAVPYTKGTQTVPPEACKAWLAKLLAAQARQASLTIQYVDSYGSCAAQPMWGDASIPWAIWE